MPVVQVYQSLAESVISEVEALRQSPPKPQVSYNPTQNKVILDYHDKKGAHQQKPIDPFEMRAKCNCAGCVDEISGVRTMKKENIPKDVYPTAMQSKGNYAVAVVWSDGHRSSIYPYERLLRSDL